MPQTLTAVGGTLPYSWSVFSGSLPPGLSLSSGGVISGTPTTPGTFNFTARVTDNASNTADQPLSITITQPALFPSVILDLQADLYIGGDWQPITPYIYAERQRPHIRRGRPDESGQASASTADFQVNNRDNRFSIHNPLGAYYPGLQRNTPLRIHIPGPAAYLSLENDSASYASAPSAAALNVSGDLDVRIDLDISDWMPATLAGKWNSSGLNRSWAWLLDSDGLLKFQISKTGSNTFIAKSTQPLPWPGGRISLRAVYGSGFGTVTFWYATSIGGSWTQLGAVVSIGATGAINAGSAPVIIGYNPTLAQLPGYQGTLYSGDGVTWRPAAYGGLNGKVFEFQMLNGINGPLVADANFTAQAPGSPQFTDAQGNVWSMAGTSEITSRNFRFHGEVPDWEPRSDPSGTDVYTDVTASGQLRRMTQNTPPLASALTRAWKTMTGGPAPVAYWPCEDGNNLTIAAAGVQALTAGQAALIASGLPGGKPMGLSGPVTGANVQATEFGSDSSFACTYPLPVPGTQSWTGPVPPYTQGLTPPSANVVTFLLHVPSNGDTNDIVLAQFHAAGAWPLAAVAYNTTSGGVLTLKIYDETGASNVMTCTTGVNGQLLLVQFSVQATSGGVNSTGELTTLQIGAATAQRFQMSLPSAALGRIQWVKINPTGAQVGSGIGQIAVQSQYAQAEAAGSAASLIGPFNAWAGETAGLRFARLAAEQGYASRIMGYPSASVTMGPQSPQSLIGMLAECEAADHGMIFEPRAALAVGYRCNMALQNQALDTSAEQPVSFDYSSAELGSGGMAIEPADDDQLLVNDEIVTRSSGPITGSSAEAALTADEYSASAALSVQPPPAGAGVYQDSRTVNSASDARLPDHAAWIVHLRTVGELRYPGIPLDLSRAEIAAKRTAALKLDLGDMLSITTPPPWLSPDKIKAIIWAADEELGGYIHRITFTTQPESPYETLAAGSGALSDCRADADGSFLTSNIGTADTSIFVTAVNWYSNFTQAGGDLPFDIIIGGERMTVTSAGSPNLGPQNLVVTRAVNGIVKAHLAGEPARLFQPCYYPIV